MVNAQKWFQDWLKTSCKTRSQVINDSSINISNKQLEGPLQLDLGLDKFPNLEEFDCSNNQITKISFMHGGDISDVEVHSSKKQKLEGQKLKKLNLINNSFQQDLSFLENLTELEELNLANNKFTGSLEPLKNLTKLKKLDISNNTDIDSGLEYLPESLEEIRCSSTGTIADELFKAVKENDIEEIRNFIETKKLKNINFYDKHGNTLLHYAIRKDSLPLLKFLVKRGGNVNAVSNYGWSVLHKASFEIVNDRGDWNVIELLLENGAKTEVETASGLTARDIFFQKDYSYIEKYDNLVEKVFQQNQNQILVNK